MNCTKTVDFRFSASGEVIHGPVFMKRFFCLIYKKNNTFLLKQLSVTKVTFL